MPEVYIIIARKVFSRFFWRGEGARALLAPPAVSYAYGHSDFFWVGQIPAFTSSPVLSPLPFLPSPFPPYNHPPPPPLPSLRSTSLINTATEFMGAL